MHQQMEDLLLFGVKDHYGCDDHGDGEETEIDNVLPFVGDRPLWQDFLQFPGGHQAARERERAKNDFSRQHRHRERFNVRGLEVILGRADQRNA